MQITQEMIWLAAIAFPAALINGALGYGFSSITVPLALLFLTSRQLNPALVLVEVAINAYVLALHWKDARAAARRVGLILVGLLPGVALGSMVLKSVSPGVVKLFTYAILLPLILLQAGGIRRPMRSERAIGLPFGFGVGFLYAITTISGPPLAVLFNNQGYTKQEFRASLAVVRVVESSMTAVAYLMLGVYSVESLALIPSILPAVLLGVPLGSLLIRRIEVETFRRVCMSFDAWIVAFGLSRVLVELGLISRLQGHLVLAAVIAFDLGLLASFFRRRASQRRAAAATEAQPP